MKAVPLLPNASNQSAVTQYEYGPFGEVIRATGPMAKVNPFRFSSKYDDDESGFLYYGHRYYNPSAGRWPSRDPIGEEGGENVYAFLDNDAINDTDASGLASLSYTSDGETHRQGGGSSTHSGNASGQQNLPSAWFYQSAEENGSCPGGLCNSGGTGDSSSFVDASVQNTGNCPLSVTCNCTISWNGNTHSPRHEGSFQAKGVILATSFNKSYLPKKHGSQWISFGSSSASSTATFNLAAGGSYHLYRGITIVVVHAPSGAGWSEAMNGTCSCTAK